MVFQTFLKTALYRWYILKCFFSIIIYDIDLFEDFEIYRFREGKSILFSEMFINRNYATGCCFNIL